MDINAIVVRPGCAPEYIDNLKNSYESVRDLFQMERVFMTTYMLLSEDGILVLGDDNAKIDNLPLNRILEEDFWFGTVVVVKENQEQFDDEDEACYCRMNKEEIDNIMEMFTNEYPPVHGKVEFNVFTNPINPRQQIQQLKIDGKVVQESNFICIMPIDGEDDLFSFLGL